MQFMSGQETQKKRSKEHEINRYAAACKWFGIAYFSEHNLYFKDYASNKLSLQTSKFDTAGV